ncbi:MAG: CopD family protein [Gammaproteobacteria bacterium]|nr:MAG: CopD family protein [Gammaproteobacteria bacterium]
MGIALSLHVLAVVVWVGGLFFAYMVLRPEAASQLEPPARLALWSGVFRRFFPWVFVCIGLILLTGFWMITAFFGGFAVVGTHVHLMLGLGIVMMLIFFHVFFAPFKRLKQAVANADWPEGGRYLAQIRVLVAVNLVLGVVTIAIASAGRFMQ